MAKKDINQTPIPKISDMKAALHDRKNEQRQYAGAEYFKQFVFVGIKELYQSQGYNKHAFQALKEIQAVFLAPEEEIEKECALTDEQAKCPHLGKVMNILSPNSDDARCPVCRVKLIQDTNENGAPQWRHP